MISLSLLLPTHKHTPTDGDRLKPFPTLAKTLSLLVYLSSNAPRRREGARDAATGLTAPADPPAETIGRRRAIASPLDCGYCIVAKNGKRIPQPTALGWPASSAVDRRGCDL